MPTRENLDKVFLNVAKEIGSLSSCISKKVGAVAVKDGRLLSTGYNGTPPGHQNCCDHFKDKDPSTHREWSNMHETHAEMNVLNFAAKNGISLNGATLYCTLQPCWQCSKNFGAAGITRVVYKDLYDAVTNTSEIEEFLRLSGITIERLSD
jgi:dCMP deaminase